MKYEKNFYLNLLNWAVDYYYEKLTRQQEDKEMGGSTYRDTSDLLLKLERRIKRYVEKEFNIKIK